MDSGSGLDPDTGNKGKGSGNGERKFGAFLKRVEPFLPRKDLNPRDLRSWAKKTGFVSDYSGETSTSTRTKFGESSDFDLPKGRDHQIGQGSSRKIDLDPILGRDRPKRGSDIEHVTGSVSGSKAGPGEVERGSNRNEDRNAAETPSDRNAAETPSEAAEAENEGGKINRDLENGFYYPGGGEAEDGGWPKPIVMKYGLRDNPGFGQFFNLSFFFFL